MLIFERSRRFSFILATVIWCLASMIAESSPKKPKDNPSKNQKEAHDHKDASPKTPPPKPSAKDAHGDGNNGHGNDSGGVDSSNPGNSGSNGKGGTPSVKDLLGISDDGGKKDGRGKNDPDGGVNPIQPSNVTDNPFSNPTGSGTTNSGDTNPSGDIAYGSIPLISDDEASVDFLLQKLIAAAEKSSLAVSESAGGTDKLERAYRDYARNLAKTLSRLSQKQQNLVFYGVE